MDIPYLLVLGTKPEQERQDYGLDNLFANITVKVSFYLLFSFSHEANVFLFFLLSFILSFYVTTEVVREWSLCSPHAKGGLRSLIEGPICVVVSISPAFPFSFFPSFLLLSSFVASSSSSSHILNRVDKAM